ncbi:MAG: hypothetical protein LBI29_04265 [Rickettsiales bacterium]|jgi:hypothetical protein|nr:hypothetical protein [Rickettsiales bacterium]
MSEGEKTMFHLEISYGVQRPIISKIICRAGVTVMNSNFLARKKYFKVMRNMKYL